MQVKQTLKRVLPTPLLEGMRLARDTPPMLLQKGLERCEYTISRSNDYYSPLPSRSQLWRNKHRCHRPSGMRGIAYDLDKMKAYLCGLISKYYGEFTQLPPYSQVIQSGLGPGYTPIDALLLYMMIRERRPTQYVEVGSGVSTYYASAAAKVNTAEGHPLSIKCIEPYPYQALLKIPDIECCQQEVQDLDLSIFSSFASNDVLFIDSSHVMKLDGDVLFLYLEVLPALRPGVLVHVHDVPFPYNIPYPPNYGCLAAGGQCFGTKPWFFRPSCASTKDLKF